MRGARRGEGRSRRGDVFEPDGGLAPGFLPRWKLDRQGVPAGLEQGLAGRPVERRVAVAAARAGQHAERAEDGFGAGPAHRRGYTLGELTVRCGLITSMSEPRSRRVLGAVLSLSILLLACKQNDPPDLAQISKEYCAIVQTCDPNEPWGDQDGCEAESAEEFEKARMTDKECFDTRIVMETCIGSFESCDEYAKFQYDNDGDCLREFMDFYVACMLP